jgi:hypothetical protein
MSPRWAFDLPDVVAFFVSMNSSRAGTKYYFLELLLGKIITATIFI